MVGGLAAPVVSVGANDARYVTGIQLGIQAGLLSR
jgi:hypothetical protein